jgi:hypothetical protein
MGLLDTIKDITQDTIDSQPQTLYGTVTKYYDGSCTVETDDGILENIQCVNIPKIGTACLLIPVEDTYNCIPNEIDETTSLYAMGLGKFNINDDGDLNYELPIGITNYFTLNNNGDLIITLDAVTNQRFSINDDGCVIYEE